MKKKGGRVAYYGLMLAAAVLLGWVEHVIPVPIPVPGIKLGLANIIVLLLLYRDGVRTAAAVNFARILLVSLLFGGLSAFIYSFCGGLLATAGMALLYRIKKLGPVGVSVAGALLHNAGQLGAACAVTGTAAPFFYMPYLAMAAAVCGTLNGVIAGLLRDRLPPVDKAAGR